MSATSGIQIFVISLVESTERRTAISGALAAIGLEFDFVDAVDGRKGLPEDADFDRGAMRRRLGREMSDCEVATALSHRNACERLLEGSASHAVILEDDAIPSADLPGFLEAGGCEKAPLVLFYHSNARVMPGPSIALASGVEGRRLAVPCFGAVGYSVSRKAAEYLLDANTPVVAPADWPGDITRIGAVVTQPQLVGHPPQSPAQSLLTQGGRKRGRAPFSRVVDPAYVRRVWRKAQSERIS